MERLPERIVCLSEEYTEILYHLGEEQRIVGITEYTCRPPRAREEKEMVSQFLRADLDRIEELEPDLILGFSDLQADIAAELIRRGLDVAIFNQRSVRDILHVVETTARLVGRDADGRAYADELAAHVQSVQAAADRLPRRPRTYFEEWPKPCITAIGWVAELVEIAGGRELFPEHRGGVHAQDRTTDWQTVREREPELMLASWCGARFNPRKVRERPGWDTLACVRDDQLVEIPSEIILQPGPAALTDGLDAIHRAIVRRLEIA
jgi:iron complex transport system substrate-binding protein